MEKVAGRGSIDEDSEATPKSVRPPVSVAGSTACVSLGFVPTSVSLSRRQRLALGQLAVEVGMLREVVDQHVSPSAGHAGLLDVRGGELRGQAVVRSAERGEALEHLPVARRLRASARDDVTAVLAVGADRLEELPALGQRLAERRA
jgi:hypothetical protein